MFPLKLMGSRNMCLSTSFFYFSSNNAILKLLHSLSSANGSMVQKTVVDISSANHIKCYSKNVLCIGILNELEMGDLLHLWNFTNRYLFNEE